jgi:peroxiredoxin
MKPTPHILMAALVRNIPESSILLRLLAVALVVILGAAAMLIPDQTPPDAPPNTNLAATALMELSLPDTHGKEQAIAQWKGKIIVANYWAPWCPPCRAEIPDFVTISRDFADKPVQFVGISLDGADKVQAFGEQFAVPYPLLIAPLQVLDQSAVFGNTIKALPLTVIIDRKGLVRHVKLGAIPRDELETRLRQLLAEPG